MVTVRTAKGPSPLDHTHALANSLSSRGKVFFRIESISKALDGIC
jgi:hypothetical protein